MQAPEVTLTLFTDRYAKQKVERCLPLDEMPELLGSVSAPCKEALPLLKLGLFGDQPTDNGALRSNDNLLVITGIEGDHDAGIMSIDEVVERLKAAELIAIVKPTPSHTPEKPRWHILCPTSTRLPPQRRVQLMARLNGVLGGVLTPESWTLSQAYFYGSVVKIERPKIRRPGAPAPNGIDRTIHVVHGSRYIDEAADLDAGALDRNGKLINDTDDDEPHTSSDPEAPIGSVVATLDLIPNEDDDRPWENGSDGWNEIGMAIFRSTGGSEDGFAAFDAWSARSAKYDAGHTRERWDHYWTSPPNRIGFGKLVYLARQTEPDWEPPHHDEEDPVVWGPWPPWPGSPPGGEGTAETEEPEGAETTGAKAGVGGASSTAPKAAAAGGSGDPHRIVVYDAATDRKPVEPRQWLLGSSFCRKYTSLLSAPGAVGKTTVRITQFWALASGREELTGETVWKPGRVLWLCFEDGIDDVRRRIRAAQKFYDIDPSAIDGAFLYASLGPRHGKLRETNRRGHTQEGGLRARIEAAIQESHPDLLCLDPLIKTHAVKENDNTEMNLVVEALAEIAIAQNIATDIIDHDRKGANNPGDQDRNRGASSKIDAVRLGYSLTVMSPNEAEDQFGIAEEDRKRFLRYDSAKVNLCPPQKARWYELVEQALDNGDETYPNGDKVQVAKLWLPSASTVSPNDPTEADKLALIVAEIDVGLSGGHLYSNENSARKRAAWPVAKKHYPGKSMAEWRGIINRLIQNEHLVYVEYWDTKRREPVKGLLKQP